MRSQALSTLTAGMTRQRDKGGASPESLYELTNGFVDASGAPTSRDGTVFEPLLPDGTKGLCAFQDVLHVFALSNIDPGDPLYVVNILIHPDENFAGTIKKIHFAKPFLGFLYVVAEFSNGDVYHYWLQVKGSWTADTVYMPGDIVMPTTPNGFLYKATVATNPTAWAPGVVRNLGDTVQPTTANGWYYVVTEVDGDAPASGTVEPDWPVQEGATIAEDVDTTPPPTNAGSGSSGGSPAGSRYDNLPGQQSNSAL